MLPDVLVNHTLSVELFFIRPDASDWRSVNACHLMCFGISKTDNQTLPGELFFMRPDASDWRSVNACHFILLFNFENRIPPGKAPLYTHTQLCFTSGNMLSTGDL